MIDIFGTQLQAGDRVLFVEMVAAWESRLRHGTLVEFSEGCAYVQTDNDVTTRVWVAPNQVYRQPPERADG